jgi:hypothetical protein
MGRQSSGSGRSQQRDVVPGTDFRETPVQAKPSAPAWGGAISKALPKKSMSEIQQEEARRAAVLAMQRETVPRSSSGWANVAAAGGGSNAWSAGAAMRPTPANANPAAANVAPRGAPPARPKAAPAGPVAIVAKPVGALSSPQRSNESVDDFGASMPPPLEKWCKEQMMKLNGSEDLTLVSVKQ